ncbi:LOW QUALITY PROTEIN: immunoglobulin superfamily member 2 [Rhynchonycteris naso]
MVRIPHVTSFFLFLTKLSVGQREVTVQKGPLFRAEGYPVSTGCNVTGHQGPSEQHFQWSVYLPRAPDQEIQIVSTVDAAFSYTVYVQWVRSRDIYVERVQGNSVLLHISKLQVKDSGECECHTPNTDERYYGSYSAKTTLIVIPDTLSATMSPHSLSKEEGEPLELTCEATKDTVQHIHLSVTWYLMQDGESPATKIISLSRDFMLMPGPSYAERFVAGNVQLDKLGAATFRLSMGSPQPLDQGQLFCEATEWIQDPDGTWTSITKQQTDQTALRIQPAVRDFQVSITSKSTFTEGQLVVGSGRDPQLQGVWFFNGVEMARINADGVLSLNDDYKVSKSRQLQVSKLSPKAFSLKIFSVDPEDEGTYSCAVAEMTRARMSSWQVLQRKQSPDSHMHLQKPAVMKVVMSIQNKQQAVWEGEELTVLWKADGDKSLLFVVWWHIPQDQAQPAFMAGMDQDGIAQLGASYGKPSKRGHTRLEKVDWATFLLEVTSTTITDSGTYECRVSERTRNQARELSWMQRVSVTVRSLDKCQRNPLLNLGHNGTIEWGQFPSQFQKKTKVSQSLFRSQLLIYDATEEEAGVYQCNVDIYDRNSLHTNGPARASATSHPLRIVITLSESKLKVNSSSQVQELSINSNTVIECGSILSHTTGNLHLAVVWHFSSILSNASWLRILGMNQTHVVKYGNEFRIPRRKQKFHTEKVSQDVFQLHILNVEDSDQGQYRCAEWLLSANGTGYELGEELVGLTELKLRPTGNKVRVFKVYLADNATEHGEVPIHCKLESLGSSASLFSVMWYRAREHSGSKMLVHLKHDGLLEYGEEGLRKRLHCYRSVKSPTDFVLKLRRVEMEDAGTCWCQWQLHGTLSKWVNQATEGSQHLVLTVLPSEPPFPSCICSSASLIYLLFVCHFVMLPLLLSSILCLYWKAKMLSALRLTSQKEKTLPVDLKGAGDRPNNGRAEEKEDS